MLGLNTNGAFGGGTLSSTTPVEFRLPSGITHGDVVEIAAGLGTCLRLDDGRVLCTAGRAAIVEGVTSAEEISLSHHACARLADGSFGCWGGTNADGANMAGGCCHDGLCGVPEGASCGTDGGTCASLWCSGCGGDGQPCCDRARIGRVRCRGERSVCTDTEICVACGGVGEPY